MKVAILQMEVKVGDIEANMRAVEEGIAVVVREQSPDVVVLPELWNTGFVPKVAAELAAGQRERLCPWMAELAMRHNITLVGGSIANELNGQVYNTSFVFDASGVILAEYNKVHLFSPAKEHHVFAGGSELPTFLIDGRRAAVITCYDIRFPELARTAAVQGIKLLFVVAAWPHPRQDHWDTLLKARAIENQIFVVAANTVGTAGKVTMCGHSVVLDPWGQPLAKAGETETVLTAHIPFMLRDEAKKKMDVMADRRPDVYRL
ncbi:MAG: carbon-nitrogen family hydrolase [Selenomonadales bacterium]|nr:carbon-nitrogen family hydrolase [Selenomonadales bacterium]